MNKRKLLFFNAASSTIHEDLRTFYCCWRYKSAKGALLCNNQYFCVADSDAYLDNTHRMHCCFSTATMIRRTRRSVLLHIASIISLKIYNFRPFFHPLHSAALVWGITRPHLSPATPLGDVPVTVHLVQRICVILTQSYALRTVVKDVDLIVFMAFNTRTRLRLT